MSATGRRWRLRGRFPEDALEGAPYPALIRHLLWHRGVRTAAEASRFLEGPSTLRQGSGQAGSGEYDPLLLPGMEEALARLRQALRGGETVAVFGDFDVDGVTASAVLTQGLRELGGKVVPYIPDRFAEGYGLNLEALDTLRQAGARLLVTADCGTSSLPEVEYAGRLGMEVVILDHHTVLPDPSTGSGQRLPAAVATVNPKRQDSRYPESELASVGLAYKLMGALHESLGRPWEPKRYLDLVALGTVADMAPLQNENRWLVKRGLSALAQTERPGLRALMEAAGIDPRLVDTEAIGYALGPRLNAAGRLAHARLAFELLLEEEGERAMQRALKLTSLNQDRQRQTRAALELAQELTAGEDPRSPLIFIGHADWSAGIVGLVAGRLAEERYRPAVVYEVGEESSRASCRSIPEFDIAGALRNCSALMIRFGGHRAAAGFTTKNDKLPALKEALLRQAEEALAGVELTPVIDVDATVPLHRLTGRVIQQLSELAPFGQGNPEPTFLSRGVEVADVRTVGAEGAHLRLKLRDPSAGSGQARVTWPAIAFGLGPGGENQRTREPGNEAGSMVQWINGSLRPGQRLDVVYSFSSDRGGPGAPSTGPSTALRTGSGQALELRVKDIAPASSGQNPEPRT